MANRLWWAPAAALTLAMTLPLFLVPGAGAQVPSAQANVLYFHASDPLTMWMNTLVEDGTKDMIVCHAAGTASPVGELCPNTGGAFAYVATLNPDLEQGFALDGDAHLSLFLGGNCCTVGTAELTVTLKQGDTVVAEGAGSHLMNPAAANANEAYSEFVLDMPVAVDHLEPGPLTLLIEGTGTWTHAGISTGELRGRSALTLPITGPWTAPDAPAPEPDENRTVEDPAGNATATGNATTGPGNATQPPEPEAGGAAGGETGAGPEGGDDRSASEREEADAAAAAAEKSTPAPGALLVVAALGWALARRRR